MPGQGLAFAGTQKLVKYLCIAFYGNCIINNFGLCVVSQVVLRLR
jgi:hypothetical protein